MTQAETPDPGRTRAIAALHAFADWLAEHPEVPAPTDLNSYLHLPAADVASVDAFGAAHPDMVIKRSGSTYWCQMEVTVGDLKVTIAALTSRPEPKK